MKKLYLVEYSGGGYDDYYTKTIFITDKKSTATKYCTKFNKAVKKWKKYYSQFEDKRYGFSYIKETHVNDPSNLYSRWRDITGVNTCSWRQVEYR